jgi:ADP-ribose pyrophosphatase
VKHKAWKTTSSRPIYKNPWIDVREDVAEMPDGRTTIYGVIELGQCVGIVPFLDDDRVVLVRQYRYVQEDARWEIPTGGIKEGETKEQAAQRELQEEIGYRAEQFEWINSYYTSKSVGHETAHLYIGRDLSPAQLAPDETEFIEIQAFPVDEALQMVLDGEIMDSMSVIALLIVARRREQGARQGESV